MAKPKEKSKEAFTPDLKSIGIGVVAGVLLITIIMLAGGRVKEWSFLGIKIGFPEDTPSTTLDENASIGSVNLLSVSYEYDDWNPKSIDLRSAYESGIPVSVGHSLRLFDLFVYVPEEITDYVVVAAIYGNDELIGLTEGKRLVPRINKLGDIEIKNYHHDTDENAWRIQDDWESISIVLMYYIGEEKIGSTSNTILLNPSGLSWYQSPPYAHIKEIYYSIDDGLVRLLDLSKGLPIHDGNSHMLKIENIWYMGNPDALNRSFRIYAYVDNLENSIDEHINTEIKKGVNPLSNFEPFELEIAPNAENLVIDILRDDSVLLEQLIIPITDQDTSRLIINGDVINWPSEYIRYLDFENQSDLNSWGEMETASNSQSREYSLTGNYSMAVSVTGKPEGNYVLARYEQETSTDLVVGWIYFPKENGFTVSWAEVCTWTCKRIPVSYDEWIRFILPFEYLEIDNEPLSPKSSFWIQAEILGVDNENPYTFYLDSIQVYNFSNEE